MGGVMTADSADTSLEERVEGCRLRDVNVGDKVTFTTDSGHEIVGFVERIRWSKRKDDTYVTVNCQNPYTRHVSFLEQIKRARSTTFRIKDMEKCEVHSRTINGVTGVEIGDLIALWDDNSDKGVAGYVVGLGVNEIRLSYENPKVDVVQYRHCRVGLTDVFLHDRTYKIDSFTSYQRLNELEAGHPGRNELCVVRYNDGRAVAGFLRSNIVDKAKGRIVVLTHETIDSEQTSKLKPSDITLGSSLFSLPFGKYYADKAEVLVPKGKEEVRKILKPA